MYRPISVRNHKKLNIHALSFYKRGYDTSVAGFESDAVPISGWKIGQLRGELMDLIRIIQELRQERDKLDAIINSLEQLKGPDSMRPQFAPGRRGRRSMDAAGRLEVSRRMKKYWENRRSQGEYEPSPNGGLSVVSSMGA